MKVVVEIVLFILHTSSFSAALVQQQPQPPRKNAHHETASPPPKSLSRRGFGIVASAGLSTLVFGSSIAYADFSDLLNAPIGSITREDVLNEIQNKPTSKTPLVQKASAETSEAWRTSPLPKLYSDLGYFRMRLSPSAAAESITPLATALPFANKDTLYPSFFVGDWEVQATLQQRVFPLGTAFVPTRDLVEGSAYSPTERVGDSVTYQARYRSTSTSGEVFAIADRAHNAVALSRAYRDAAPIVASSVKWDPQRDPTTWSYEREPGDASKPPIPASVTLLSRVAEDLTRTLKPESRVFACAERTKTKVANELQDREVVVEYRPVAKDSIVGVARVAVYLTPDAGALWSQSRGKAVAFYDYELAMQRQA